MNNIKKRAHEYAVAHNNKTDGISLMRAYVAGAMSEKKKVKVFLSGKVSGLPYLVAYGNFSNAERTLASMGYEVVNPMKICRKNWSWVRCMIVCLWNLLWCDKVHQLNNWRDSKGAIIEYKVVKFLKKEII